MLQDIQNTLYLNKHHVHTYLLSILVKKKLLRNKQNCVEQFEIYFILKAAKIV